MLNILLIIPLIIEFSTQVEYLRNPDFEDDFGSDDWFCTSCNLSRSTDSFSGNYSAYVYNRNIYWGGKTIVDLFLMSLKT